LYQLIKYCTIYIINDEGIENEWIVQTKLNQPEELVKKKYKMVLNCRNKELELLKLKEGL
jgi:hypothetical protein